LIVCNNCYASRNDDISKGKHIMQNHGLSCPKLRCTFPSAYYCQGHVLFGDEIAAFHLVPRTLWREHLLVLRPLGVEVALSTISPKPLWNRSQAGQNWCMYKVYPCCYLLWNFVPVATIYAERILDFARHPPQKPSWLCNLLLYINIAALPFLYFRCLPLVFFLFIITFSCAFLAEYSFE
jgi:hypothetical protein